MMDKKIDEQKIYFEDEKKKDSKVQRAIALFASISLWAIFLYLLQFFMTSLFLAFAAIFLYGQLFTSEAAAGTWELVIFAGIVSVIAFLVLLIWAVWNKALYGGLDRRKPRPMPPDEEIAETDELFEQAESAESEAVPTIAEMAEEEEEDGEE